jgi:hypothetical protein
MLQLLALLLLLLLLLLLRLPPSLLLRLPPSLLLPLPLLSPPLPLLSPPPPLLLHTALTHCLAKRPQTTEGPNTRFLLSAGGTVCPWPSTKSLS